MSTNTEIPSAEELSERVCAAMSAADLSQRQIAGLLGISQPRVHQIIHKTYGCGASRAVVMLLERLEEAIERGQLPAA